jgi:hypothetical protein
LMFGCGVKEGREGKGKFCHYNFCLVRNLIGD